MVNPLNKDLEALRISLEHYKSVLKNDEILKKENNPDEHKLLSEKDIERINSKIEAISDKINELLEIDNGFVF